MRCEGWGGGDDTRCKYLIYLFFLTGSIECLHRTSTIEEPFYYVDSNMAEVPEVKGKIDESDLRYKMIMGVT